MAYVPTNWATGDVITAEKLNNIENGIENTTDVFYVNVTNIDKTNNTFTYDKTWNEIKNAFQSGKTIVMRYAAVTTPVSKVSLIYENSAYSIITDNGEVESLDFTRYDVEGNDVIAYTRMSINETDTVYYNVKFKIPT